MQSPLPSSSTLESGMIADPPSPYRTAGIQDSVRSILRHSLLGRLRNSVKVDDEEETIQVFNDVRGDPRSPLEDCHLVDRRTSPIDSLLVVTSKPASFVTANGDDLPANPTPTQALSTRFSLLSHPDLETNLAALGLLNQQEVLHHRRSNHNRRRRQNRHKHVKPQDTECRIFYVAISGLVLAALLSTYLAIVLDQHNVGTIFQIVFILSIMVSTILFGHAVVRLVMTYTTPPAKKKKKTNSRPKSHPRLQNTDFVNRCRPQSLHETSSQHMGAIPTLSDAERAYVPKTPIPVHFTGDDGPPRIAATVSGSETAAGDEQFAAIPGSDGVLFPPPAYGRWRESIRADPDLIHWQRAGSDSQHRTAQDGHGQ